MGKQLSIAFASFLLVTIAFTIKAQTIPANDAEVNAWFQAAVKPFRYYVRSIYYFPSFFVTL